MGIWKRTFTKMKAVALSAVVAAGAAGTAELTVVDWNDVLMDAPGPDYVKAGAVVVLIGLVQAVSGFFKKERVARYPE